MRRRRAEHLYRRAGLEPSPEDPSRRGLILIQIDSLSHSVLRASLKRRYLPFLTRLVKRGGYHLHPYQTGIPATTPAFQVGLFYGNNDHVAGFRWLDKRTGRVFNVKRPDDAADAEAIAAERAPGLLGGGAAHTSIVGGGAERTSLTLARVGREEPGPKSRTWGDLFVAALLNLWQILRLLGAAIVEAFVELADSIRAEYEGRMVRDEWPFILVRILSNVVFREIATHNVVLDIARGAPVIYVNFAGYDELAHHRGPQSVAARLALRGTDARIREIFRAAQRFGARDYDVFVFSDHGQVPTIPIDRVAGRSLSDELVHRLVYSRDLPAGVSDAELARLRTLVELQRELEQVVPRRLAWIPRRIADYIAQNLPPDPELTLRTWSEVALLPTSDICHVYVTSIPHALTLPELRGDRPALWAALVEHPAIWAVVGRGWIEEDGRCIAEICTRRGAAFVWPDGSYRHIGNDPFQEAHFNETTPAALHRFAWLPTAGDAVLVGARIHGRVVNFQEEFGGHGGPYPEEQTAFMISPPHVEFDFSAVRHHTELYRFFWSRYRAPVVQVSKTAGDERLSA
jgi:Type I phosphodiesterase / nucleotide pyrophosphatase